MDHIDLQLRNDTANEYIKILEKGGNNQLASLIMQQDAARPHNARLHRYTECIQSKSNWAFGEIIDMLDPMDNDSFQSLNDGSLSRKAEIPAGDVSNALQRIQDQKPSPPFIYQNSIWNLMGISPTPVQWERVCYHMLKCIQGPRESNELALIVDQLIYPTDKWPPHLARRDLRRYTERRSYVESDGDQLPSISHRRMVRHFMSEMVARISVDLQNGRGHIPLAAPVIKIGFRINRRY